MIRTLTIPGEPVAKSRPKVTSNGTFTPTKTKNYETLVKELYWAEYHGQELLQGPLQMTLTAFFSIPKSVSKKRRQAMLERQEWPTKRPDIDNIIKSVADALNGLAYADDSAITYVVAGKAYAEIPKVEVILKELGV